MLKYPYIFILLTWLSLTVQAQESDQAKTWAKQKLSSMDLDAKIGQLFMIRAHSDLGKEHISQIEKQVKDLKVGGVCFFQGTPTKQAELTNKYQRLADIPLLVAIDGEWGLGMRMKKTTISFPKQLTLGAIRDNAPIYDMGVEIAKQMKRIGINVNFAPVVDVNNNPDNPVIHNRSFGEDIFNVSTKAFAYSKGMQDNDLMACAKHFPGHGDTDVDSHLDLPVISHSRKRLDSLEMKPFRVLTQLGVKSIMTAHMSVPALDNSPNRPTSLSKKVITDLLINQMNFEGLIFTDALEMKGVAKHFKPGQMEVEALKAGNDILLLPIDIKKGISEIKRAIQDGRLNLEDIENKVLKILAAKYDLGLNRRPIVNNISGINKELNQQEALSMKTRLYEKAITLVKDDKKLIPFTDQNFDKIATVSLGTQKKSAFQKMIQKFGIKKHFQFGDQISSQQRTDLNTQLKKYETVIVNLLDMNIRRSKNFGISQSQFDLIFDLNTKKNVILIVHGSPYSLRFFNMMPTLIAAYEEDDLMQEAVAQAIMGVTRIEGKLPVSVQDFPVKTGLERNNLHTLGYAKPEFVNVNADTLLQIDTIMDEMLKKNAAPGCQILAAKNGRIFFHKAYGYHTPSRKKKVQLDDVYDVASVTKILASTISLMKLHDEDDLNIYAPIQKYLPQLDTTNKGPLIIEDILAHHSGLPGWIPFYEDTMEENKKGKRIDEYFRSQQEGNYNLKVTDNLYLRNDWRDSIYRMIYNCDLRQQRNYRYSDLGFYLFQQIIENKSNLKLEEYVEQNFYQPMGLKNTGFNPWKKIGLDRIPPSEKDNYFRNQVVKGYVHDMGAAMLGGVCGHAGLFSNSKDLAELMQMLLNGGSYRGHSYIKPKTVRKFTKRYYRSSRRGLGFDLKELNEDNKLNMAEEASAAAFGHLGFTGISVFADPKHDLIYIFLSNRTYPTMKNSVFSKKNYRPRVQSVFYNAIMDSASN